MVTYVFDASAVLRYFDGEAGADRVNQILKSLLRGDCRVLISAVQWGEVAGRIIKSHGDQPCRAALSRIAAMGMEIMPASSERAVHSAFIKARRKIPYADAFAVELAMNELNCLLVTSDFDFKPTAHDIKIEFLPKKA
jgi:predicted nucleic acid-binding protein